jgi:hypothetical protein
MSKININKQWNILNLSGNHIQDSQDFSLIIQNFRFFKSLKELNFSHMNLNSIAISKLSKEINNLISLEKLNLSNNPLKNSSCNDLFLPLSRMSNFNILIISNCRLNINVLSTFSILLANPNINSLDLTNNNFSGSLPLEFGLSLMSSNLERLSMEKCFLTENSAITIIKAFHGHSYLKYLNLRSNILGDNIFSPGNAIFEKNKN